MDLSIHTMLFLIFSNCLWYGQARPVYKTIYVTNGGKRGFWAWDITLCPTGYAHGFAIKVDGFQGKLMWQDDSSLNGIRLYCSDGTRIESRVGSRGIWLTSQLCPEGYLNSFALRVAKPQAMWIFGDDVGATNIKFTCNNGTILTGNSHRWGEFGDWSSSCSPAFICGMRTRIDDFKAWLDTSGLNNVLFACCF